MEFEFLDETCHSIDRKTSQISRKKRLDLKKYREISEKINYFAVKCICIEKHSWEGSNFIFSTINRNSVNSICSIKFKVELENEERYGIRVIRAIVIKGKDALKINRVFLSLSLAYSS